MRQINDLPIIQALLVAWCGLIHVTPSSSQAAAPRDFARVSEYLASRYADKTYRAPANQLVLLADAYVRDLRLRSKEPMEVTAAEPWLWGNTEGVRHHRTQILLQLDPGAAPDQITEFEQVLARELNLHIVQIIPELGVLVLQASEEIGREAPLSDEEVRLVQPDNVSQLRAVVGLEQLTDRIRELNPDLVRAAALNTVLGVNVLPPPRQGVSGRDEDGVEHFWDWSADAGDAEHNRDGNWGLKRAAFPAAWNLRKATERRGSRAVAVGVLDAGFGPHDDLNYTHSPISPVTFHDHGTHVAGIISGQWNDAGIEGGTPLADLTVASIPLIPTGNNLHSPRISMAMTDILGQCSKFVQEHPNIRVVNLSVGYNWVGNESVNPNESETIQKIVRNQGIICRGLVDFAAEMQILLVCSAGNDSRRFFAQPVHAQWNSPFNWTAFNSAPFEQPADNIIVVESIGRDGGRSQFSNAPGHIAAPGEHILSTVATENPFRHPASPPVPSTKTFAAFSGTSFAAPHVTALIALMYAYNPDLTPTDVLRILGIQGVPQDAAQVPSLQAFDALVQCRPEAEVFHDLADLNDDDTVNLLDFQSFRTALRQVEGGGGQQDLNQDGVVDTNENTYPRADLNGSGRLSRDPQDRRKLRGELLSDLDIMKRAWQDPNHSADSLESMLDH